MTAVEVAGPGFVNFRLDDGWLHDVVRAVIEAGADFGRSDVGAGRRVMVEFVSANPTGPLHAGHARGAAFGDAWPGCSTFTGHDVEREFYLNDRGVQMQMFAASLAARKAGEQPPEGGYQGEYISEWAAEMPDDADPLAWGEARAIAGPASARWPRMNVDFDTWFSERAMVDDGRHRHDARRPARPRRGLRGATVRCGCARPTSATTRTACWSRATARSPTCCPTSRTTATSSPGASTCSSTCGARTTTATCRG